MLPKTRKTRKYRRPGKSLIAAGKINPELWQKIPKGEIARALRDHAGLSVKQVKKVHHLKHQVCISYINTEGNTCSSFFSYRIFESWQKAVERLIYNCYSLKEFYSLRRYIHYDLDYFPYLVEISDALAKRERSYRPHLGKPRVRSKGNSTRGGINSDQQKSSITTGNVKSGIAFPYTASL